MLTPHTVFFALVMILHPCLNLTMEIKGCAYVAVAMLMTAWGEVGQRWHGLTSDCVKSSDSQEDEDRQVQVQSQGQFDEYGSRKYV